MNRFHITITDAETRKTIKDVWAGSFLFVGEHGDDIVRASAFDTPTNLDTLRVLLAARELIDDLSDYPGVQTTASAVIDLLNTLGGKK